MFEHDGGLLRFLLSKSPDLAYRAVSSLSMDMLAGGVQCQNDVGACLSLLQRFRYTKFAVWKPRAGTMHFLDSR